VKTRPTPKSVPARQMPAGTLIDEDIPTVIGILWVDFQRRASEPVLAARCRTAGFSASACDERAQIESVRSVHGSLAVNP
jgi:hypothetical protein